MRLLGPWLGSGVGSAVLGARSAVRAGLVPDVAQLHSAGAACSWGAPLPLLRALGGRPSPCPCPCSGRRGGKGALGCPLLRPGVRVVIALPRPESAPSLAACRPRAPTLTAVPGTPPRGGEPLLLGWLQVRGQGLVWGAAALQASPGLPELMSRPRVRGARGCRESWLCCLLSEAIAML